MTSTLHRTDLDAGPASRVEPSPVEPTGEEALAALRDAHRRAAECVAALDLTDRELWTRAGPLVSALSSAAYGLSAFVRGVVPEQTAAGVPPVVLARELGSSQSQLFAHLARHSGVSSQVLEASHIEVDRLVRLIRESDAHPDA